MPGTQRHTALRLPVEISDAMQRIKEQDGIPQSEQVRRALREWLEKRGELKRLPKKGVR
jgi:Arc/MetJ-type ribon-helix-helix transcriptional regulator